MLLNQKADGVNLLNELDHLKSGQAPYTDVIRCYIGVFLFFTESVHFGDIYGINAYFTEMLNLAERHCPELNIMIGKEGPLLVLKAVFSEKHMISIANSATQSNSKAIPLMRRV